MEENKNIDLILERVDKLLSHPETISPEQLEEWMHDKEFLSAYKMAMDCRRSMLEEKPLPDITQEFRSFHRWRMIKAQDTKPKKNHTWKLYLTAIVTAAACVLAFIFYQEGKQTNDPIKIAKSVQVYSARKDLNGVTLSVGNNVIALNSANTKSLIDSANLSMKKNGELDYKDVAQKNAPNVIHTLSTPQGKDFRLILADGTKVWVNAESKLTYPRVFNGKERVVHLQGEAYFEVKKDKRHPFIVECGILKTQVLGTSFNVRSYMDDKPHVTLVEGRVNVTKNKQRILLHPGQDATFDNQGNLISKNVDLESYICWKNGYFYFDDELLINIMIKIGRWYNMDVVFLNRNHLTDQLHFHAERNWKIDEVVKQMNMLSTAKIHIKGNTIYIN